MSSITAARRLVPLLLAVWIFGCAGGDKARVSVLESHLATSESFPLSRMGTAGDWVEYRYSGALGPMVIRKHVVSMGSERVLITVALLREERGRMRERAATVCRHEWATAARGGSDSRRPFHSWVLGDASTVGVIAARPCTIEIAGSSYLCECREGTLLWRGSRLRFSDPVCPGFVWTYGPARYVDAETGETVLDVEIIGAGRAGGTALGPAKADWVAAGAPLNAD